MICFMIWGATRYWKCHSVTPPFHSMSTCSVMVFKVRPLSYLCHTLVGLFCHTSGLFWKNVYSSPVWHRLSYILNATYWECMKLIKKIKYLDSIWLISLYSYRPRLAFVLYLHLIMTILLLLVKLRTIGNRAFAVAAPNIWNSLPTVLTSLRQTHCQLFVDSSSTFYFDNHILTLSTDITQSVVLAVATPLRPL